MIEIYLNRSGIYGTSCGFNWILKQCFLLPSVMRRRDGGCSPIQGSSLGWQCYFPIDTEQWVSIVTLKPHTHYPTHQAAVTFIFFICLHNQWLGQWPTIPGRMGVETSALPELSEINAPCSFTLSNSLTFSRQSGKTYTPFTQNSHCLTLFWPVPSP